MSDKSQSLERGIAILELLDSARLPIGIREIARRLALSPSIVQRLIRSLHQANYVAQDAETQRYSLGYRSLSLGSSLATEDNLISAAMPVLSRMTRELEVNAFLAVTSSDRLVYVLALQSAGPIAIRSASGTIAAFHSTAMGKVLLAEESSDRVDTLLGRGELERFTEATLTDRKALAAQLDAIRAQGYATSEEENLPGVVAAGACVRNASGRCIAAISAAYAPHLQPELKLPQTIAATMRAANEISLSLGCPETLLKKAVPLSVVGGNVA